MGGAQGDAAGGGAAPAEAGAAEAQAARVAAARMLTYRLIPVWLFLITFGAIMVWEVGVRGNPVTADKLQAAALLSLLVALILGATVGIRYFNPNVPKT